MNSKEKLEKGYKLLLSKDNLDYLIGLSNKLTNAGFNSKNDFFNFGKEKLERSLMQFLIQRIIDAKLNYQILISLGDKKKKVSLALPLKWLKILEKEGFKANIIENRVRWLFFVLWWYLAGVYMIFYYFFKGITAQKYDRAPFVYFENLSKNNLPKIGSNKSRTIIDWYFDKWPNQHLEILHNVENSPRSSETNKYAAIYYSAFPFKVHLTKIEWIIYLMECLKTGLFVFFAFIRGDFIHALLLKELPLLYLSKKKKNITHGKQYLFHNSTRIFRPLWTYIPNEVKTEVILYYYSTNSAYLKFEKGYLNGFGNKHFMSWNNVWVWNEHQKHYLEQYLPKAKIDVVGPIWFSSSTTEWELNADKSKIVSIFDIQTVTEDTFKSFGSPDRYLTTPNMIQFHLDIIEALKSIKNVKIVLKRKRAPKHGFHDPKYLDFVETHYNNDKFLQIDPDLDALTLIEHSFLSISFPATSTAYMAKYYNKHSIYYDPTKKVDNQDRALSGVQLICGKEELEKYVHSLF